MGVNKVFLLGRATGDAELKQTKNGKNITNCSIATNRYWKSPDGQKQEEVEFTNLTFFGNQAEVASKITKGMIIFIEGRMKTDKWEDQQGNKKSKTGVIVERFEMINTQPVDNSQNQVDMVNEVFNQ